MAKIRFFRFFVLALCICLVPAFAGCSLVTTNLNKQLSEVAMSFDNGRVEITREELIVLYNSMGNSQFDNGSTPTKEGVESTLELALNREILIDFLTADDMADLRSELNVQKITLTMAQANDVWRNVYDYINTAVESYETDLRADDDAQLPTTTDEETDSTAYTPYDKTYLWDTLTNTLVKQTEEVRAENESVALFDTTADLSFSEKADIAYETFRKLYWNYTDSIEMNPNATNTTSYSDRAWTQFINQLIQNENGRNLSTDPEEVFLRQVEIIYKLYYENAVLQAFQENFENGLAVTKQMVYEKYQELYNEQFEEFSTNSSAFDDLVATSAQDVYYMKNTSGYFKVNHILVEFNDPSGKIEDITAEIENYQEQLDNLMIDKETYDKKVAALKSKTKAYNRETGQYEPRSDVMNSLISSLNSAQSQSAKLAVFRDFMHKYSNDDATLNAEACYYIPTDSSLDSMVTEFADASRDIYDNGNGTVGTITGWVETEYGYHIIMYTGTPTNVDANGAIDVVLSALNNYYLNPVYSSNRYKSKTMLDKVIEQVTLASYSTLESNILDAIKANKDIVTSESVYSDLYS